MFGANIKLKINDKKLKWFEPVLSQWLLLNREYIERYDCNDSLYWYNERTNISSLAGAVWRSGGYVLEEYSAKKGKGRSMKNGRVDLFIDYANNHIICEAKQKWIYLCKNQKTDFKNMVAETTKKSLKDLQHTQDSQKVKYGFALSFFTTYTKDKGVEDSMKTLQNTICNSNCSFYAWYENDSGKDIVSGKGNICNAVLLVGNTL